MRRAIFLDRDGVLNVYLPGAYATVPDELIIQQGAATAVQQLREAGYLSVLISNQQGVGKGIMTEADLERVTKKLQAEVELDAIYYCKHLKEDECACRKPKPGMLIKAAQEHALSLSESYFIGDTPTDAQAAQAAGVPFILVLTGQTVSAEGFVPLPAFVAQTLTDAAAWILAR